MKPGVGLRPALAVFGALAASAALSLFFQAPPRPLGTMAPVASASAARAMRHVEKLSATPRVAGSREARAARDGLVRDLEALGLETRLLADTVITRDNSLGRDVLLHAEAIVARIPGTSSGGGAALFTAHYDSVANAPGAADDAAGVAAIFEAARAIRSGPPLRNDLLLLFTGNEEISISAAVELFFRDDPDAWRVRAAFAFDHAGNRGPAFLLGSSRGNDWIVRHVAPAGVRGSSAIDRIGKLLSAHPTQTTGSTEGTTFAEHGLPVAEIGLLQGYRCYHVSCDDAANLEIASLQHLSDIALALMRRTGSSDLEAAGAVADRTFFRAGPFVIQYGRALEAVVTVASVGAWIAALVRLRRRRDDDARGRRWRGLALGFSGGLVALVLAVGGAWASTHLAGLSSDPDLLEAQGALFALAAIPLSLALASAPIAAALRFGRDDAGVCAGLLLWWLLALLGTLALPPVAWLFAWPLFFAALGLRRSPLAVAAGLTPGVFLLTDVAATAWMTTGRFAIVDTAAEISVVCAFAAMLMAPAVTLVPSRLRLFVSIPPAVAAAVLLSLPFLVPAYGPGTPFQTAITFATWCSSGEGTWTGWRMPEDPWTDALFPGGAGTDGRWTRSGPVAPALEVPTVERIDGPGIRLRVRSSTPRVMLLLTPEPPVIRVAGRPWTGGGWIVIAAMPPDGVLLELDGVGALDVSATALHDEMPWPDGVTPRPAHLAPMGQGVLSRDWLPERVMAKRTYPFSSVALD